MNAQPAATGIDAVLDEVRSTRQTAEQIANEGPSEGADVARVLAGLISHLAEQVERLGSVLGDQSAPPPSTPSGKAGGLPTGSRAPVDSDSTESGEEDISPEDAPAEPRRDPEAAGEDVADADRPEH